MADVDAHIPPKFLTVLLSLRLGHTLYHRQSHSSSTQRCIFDPKSQTLDLLLLLRLEFVKLSLVSSLSIQVIFIFLRLCWVRQGRGRAGHTTKPFHCYPVFTVSDDKSLQPLLSSGRERRGILLISSLLLGTCWEVALNDRTSG